MCVCYQLQGGYVPPSPDVEEWAQRVRAAFGIPDTPEPKLPEYVPDRPSPR
jgi:hypothetical protein